MTPVLPPNRLILVVDSDESIHEVFSAILQPEDEPTELIASQDTFLGSSPAEPSRPYYELEYATSGEEAIEKVTIAVEAGQAFALAFIDFRLYPGLDGIETIKAIWEQDPGVQIVLASAHSDFSWETIYNHFGNTDQLFLMRKPLEADMVRQLALALTEKWALNEETAETLADLQRIATQNTQELQKANQTIQEYSEHLEEVLEEQTRQLVKTERQALFGQLVQGIVHNLKNPLTIASGNARLVRMAIERLKEGMENCKDELQHSCWEYTGEIDKYVLNMEQAVTNLNDMVLSLMERGRMDISTDNRIIDFNDLVRSELQFMNADPFFKKEVIKHINLSEEELPVQVVPGDVAQVIGNLVRNSLEAMYDLSGPELYVRTVAENGWATLTVRDNGPGVPDEIRNRIFEPFFTTKKLSPNENPDTRKPVGTGLGLWMCREALQGCGGNVELEDTTTPGTTFTVRLPLKN